MKILLIGPFPPPHGGVSVHIAGIDRDLTAAGVRCNVLNTDRIQWPHFIGSLMRHARQGWTLHLHTNGHNRNSWLLALICGLSGCCAAGSVLTLHSGMAPAYLAGAFPWHRKLARVVTSLYKKIICVNAEIRDTLTSIGVPMERTEVIPAYTGLERPEVALAEPLVSWVKQHRPLLSTTLFFRPEYGGDLLIDAVARLRTNHPAVGCLMMGSGEDRAGAELRIRDAGLGDSVLILGDVDHKTCLRLMSLSDVFLRTTLHDGDSISVREALSLGVPVVASRTGARPACAILFRPGDLPDLVLGIESALAAGTYLAGEAPVTGCMDRLFEVYRQVVRGVVYASA